VPEGRVVAIKKDLCFSIVNYAVDYQYGILYQFVRYSNNESKPSFCKSRLCWCG